MDIARSGNVTRRRKRQIVIGGLAAAVLLTGSLVLARLQPAGKAVPRESVWIDAVKRGPMLRQVRGLGTLVPEEVRWIPAESEGRVERLIEKPGSTVEASTVVLVLSNPEVELRALESESQLRAAEAAYAELKVRLQSQHLDQEAAAARVQAEYQQARLRAEADEQLAKDGLVADITRQLSRSTAEELENRLDIDRRRLAIAREAIAAQLLVQAAEVEQRRGLARLRRGQKDGLQVRAGVAGVLQQVTVEVGQQVAPGANLARVAQPSKLKAVIRVPETQARDIQPGQAASIDTRNGIAPGRVVRVDPAVQNGTVTVDVALEGELPKGARPDLTVDGLIELEKLGDVLSVGRPAQGQPGSRVGLFRMEADGVHARRVAVGLGRASVSAIEIVDGLVAGDRVILSDTTAWDSAERIRLE